MAETKAPALKEMFNAARFRAIAKEVTALYPRFDTNSFLARSLAGLDHLTLTQRLRRMTACLRTTLPPNYRRALGILNRLAPRIDRGFTTLFLPDFVGLYGLDDFETSMEALRYFTTFGSSEFAVREFLRRDLARTLTVMETWSRDPDEDVRRLASEGCRPRLPWSFRLDALTADPSPVIPILENLRDDPSLYVRKSVANHLNDIAKDHPSWVLDRMERWPLESPRTAWIAKRALRTLIKKGDRRALAVIGAGRKPEVVIPQVFRSSAQAAARRATDAFLCAHVGIQGFAAPRRGLHHPLRQKVGRQLAKGFQTEGSHSALVAHRFTSSAARRFRISRRASIMRSPRSPDRGEWGTAGEGFLRTFEVGGRLDRPLACRSLIVATPLLRITSSRWTAGTTQRSLRAIALFEAAKGAVVLVAGAGLLQWIHHHAQHAVDGPCASLTYQSGPVAPKDLRAGHNARDQQ
jgi:3-methyladenine DNA glycosylase AlkC